MKKSTIVILICFAFAAGDDICIKIANLTNPYTADLTITNVSLTMEKIPIW